MSGKIITEGRKRFKLKELISKARKEKIEKHPQSKDNFRFKKNGNSSILFAWFVRINPYTGASPKIYRNTSLFEK